MPIIKRNKRNKRGVEQTDGGRVSPLRSKCPESIAAVLCSDIHLSLKAPRCRGDDWKEVMRRGLKELGEIAGGKPIICAGDLFDYWKAEPELINIALKYLPDNIYAIPGQHDLPLHDLDLLHRSAFYTLVQAGKIKWLREPEEINGITFHPFPWGKEIQPCENSGVNVAVAHRYIWGDGFSYPGAVEVDKVENFHKPLKGYDVAHFGDNHKGFRAVSGKCLIINTGTFFRRKSDEAGYKPMVGLLSPNGDVKSYFLDTSNDNIIDTGEGKKEEKDELDIREFLTEMKELSGNIFDFREAVNQAFQTQKTPQEIQKIILEIMK